MIYDKQILDAMLVQNELLSRLLMHAQESRDALFDLREQFDKVSSGNTSGDIQ